ncbi:hypothetical protein, partial [Paraburkholderia sp. RL17-381-BIF-C]|uniref:hypothetical protein n=1 Tax=Paraburkholderia sp. RL17-381-BIF-C TaxID=3031635 RepID=UPI0038B98EEF
VGIPMFIYPLTFWLNVLFELHVLNSCVFNFALLIRRPLIDRDNSEGEVQAHGQCDSDIEPPWRRRDTRSIGAAVGQIVSSADTAVVGNRIPATANVPSLKDLGGPQLRARYAF